MRIFSLRVLSVAVVCAWLAGCGDNLDAPIDGLPCTPVDDGNACTIDGCDGETPIHTPVAAGEACPAGVCDGDGACVACLDNDDCQSPQECDQGTHTCILPTCTDGSQNGTETDIDCGGACAPMRRCDDGDGCAIPGDCTSGVCTGMVCQVARCGDGVRQGAEACDDGNNTNGDGCDDGVGGSCRPTGCGNGTRTGSEECDDGNAANGDGCDNNCTTTRCGNGVIAGSEMCDDSGVAPGDGCSDTCMVETGYTCTMVPSVCVGTCGDGVVVPGEACDDPPPAENGDGCSATCTVELGWGCTGSPSVCTTTCGDGIRAGAEGCDDPPPAENGDGCNASCFVEPGWVCTGTPSLCFPICGDGRVVPTEECDDPPPAENGDGCSSTCRLEPGWTCSGSPSVCSHVCGDGIVLPGDACDDGDLDSGDGCSSTCTLEPGWTCAGSPSVCTTTCGDGIRAGLEECDDAPPAENGDGCSATCTVEPGYSCIGSTPSTCTPVCGDGMVRPGEPCDDGCAAGTPGLCEAADDGDGCSSTCMVEPGYVCSGEPSVCLASCGDGVLDAGEGCDDGCAAGVPGTCEPVDDGDGCSAGCAVEFGWTCSGAPSTCTTTCGDGLKAATEACDDAPPAEDGDGCSATCTVEPGWGCSGDMPSVCGLLCGNGIVDPGEECDDAPPAENGDGCSATCTVEPGYSCTPTSPSVCSPLCGNGTIDPGEQCDDANMISLDGCSPTCRIEPLEIEPNEDGVTATGGSGISGNDFDAAGGIAVANANANAALIPLDVHAGPVTVLAAINPAGDEDVFQVRNGSTNTVYTVRFDIWNRAAGFGIGAPCPSAANFDTGLNIRNAAGVVLVSNDDRNGASDRCSGLSMQLLPGQVVYAHVVEFGDNAILDAYALQIVPSNPVLIVCGDGIATFPTEQCDDGNTIDTDACSNSCTINATTEIEPNGTIAQADATGLVATSSRFFSGAITPIGDLDLYRIEVTTTTVLRLETFVGGLNCDTTTTTVRLLDSGGVEITNDNAGATNASGIAGCGALVIPVTPGTYYVQVEETGNNASVAAYFLEIAFNSSAGTESEPNDTIATANSNLSGVNHVFVAADHSVIGDLDYYLITIPPGQGLRAEVVEGDRSIETCESNGVDSRLSLFDLSGTLLVEDDDDGRGWCSALDGTGASPRDAAARNTTSTPQTRVLQVRNTSTSAAGEFIYRLQVTLR